MDDTTRDPQYDERVPDIDDAGDIAFLTVAQVHALHRRSLERYSPGESDTVLNPGLLESAVLSPQQTFAGDYVYPTVAHMAAAYLYGLALNHAFENGNKRISLYACSTFLLLNGYRLTLTADQAERMVLDVISKALDREGLVHLIQNALASHTPSFR